MEKQLSHQEDGRARVNRWLADLAFLEGDYERARKLEALARQENETGVPAADAPRRSLLIRKSADEA